MALDPSNLPEAMLGFLAERHLASLTSMRADGTPHVVPVGFAFDPGAGLVRIITNGGSQKARNVEQRSRAVVCQVDGGRWLSLEGWGCVTTDPERVAAAVTAYAGRYRQPGQNPDRVAIEITVDRILGRG